MKKLITLFSLALISVMTYGQWALSGNTGTSEITDFVGTTDPVDLRFRTDNTFRFGVTSTGRFGINTTAPDMLLHVDGGGLLVTTS